MSSEGPISQFSQMSQMYKSKQYLVGWQVLPSETPRRNQHVQWRQNEQNALQASGGIKKPSCLLQNICTMLLAQGKWARCFPQEPLQPGGPGGWQMAAEDAFLSGKRGMKRVCPEPSWSLDDRPRPTCGRSAPTLGGVSAKVFALPS